MATLEVRASVGRFFKRRYATRIVFSRFPGVGNAGLNSSRRYAAKKECQFNRPYFAGLRKTGVTSCVDTG